MRIRNDLVPGLPAYEADNDGSDAPWVWYGQSANRAFSASAEPWNSAPLLSQWFDRTTDQVYRKTVAGAAGAWELVGRLSGRTVTVGVLGQYTTLSAALAAITDASDTNEYLIVVSGEIAETAAITAKSHVHVFFTPGACVTVTSVSASNGVNFSSVSNTIWAAADATKPHIIRAGVIASGAAHGLYTTACGATVGLYNLYVQNTTTGQASCHGIYNLSGSSPTMTNCTGNGGAGGTGCHGIYNASSSPTMTNCTGVGGAGGASCVGICNYASSPTMTNCVGVGGAGGASCIGIYNVASSSPTMTNCTGNGGAGGTGCVGIYNASSSSPRLCRCLGFGGGTTQLSATATIAASTRTDDAYQPAASFPFRIIGIYLSVSVAAAGGVTITFRDAAAGGGNALSGAVAVSTTGEKFVPLTGWQTISAGGYFYGNLSAEDSTLAYTIRYAYTIEYSTCYGLHNDSNARHDYLNCVFLSNGASSAVYVSNNGDDQSLFQGGVARSGMNTASRAKAFTCQSAWNPASVYNMVLDGGSTNLTCAAGTANGTCVEV